MVDGEIREFQVDRATLTPYEFASGQGFTWHGDRVILRNEWKRIAVEQPDCARHT
jgi:hypothetical protein